MEMVWLERMLDEWKAWIQPLVTTIGFIFVIWQIQNARRSIRTQARSQVYGLGIRLYENLINHPKFIDYLYRGKDLPSASPDREEVFVATEMLCDFFEFVLAEDKTIGGDVRPGWTNMMKTMVRNSPVIRSFVQERRAQYTPKFLKVFDEVLAEKNGRQEGAALSGLRVCLFQRRDGARASSGPYGICLATLLKRLRS